MLTHPDSYHCLKLSNVALGTYRISPIRSEHIEAIRCWRNAQMEVLRQTSEITPEQQQGYFANTIWPDMASPFPSNILFSYFKDREHIGYGGLVHLAWEHRRAEISFLVAPERAELPAQYRADLTHFLALMANVAFTDLGLNRLFTETYAQRESHISILEDFGLRPEGRMREHVVIEGVPTDSLIHGYLRGDHVE